MDPACPPRRGRRATTSVSAVACLEASGTRPSIVYEASRGAGTRPGGTTPPVAAPGRARSSTASSTSGTVASAAVRRRRARRGARAGAAFGSITVVTSAGVATTSPSTGTRPGGAGSGGQAGRPRGRATSATPSCTTGATGAACTRVTAPSGPHVGASASGPVFFGAGPTIAGPVPSPAGTRRPGVASPTTPAAIAAITSAPGRPVADGSSVAATRPLACSSSSTCRLSTGAGPTASCIDGATSSAAAAGVFKGARTRPAATGAPSFRSPVPVGRASRPARPRSRSTTPWSSGTVSTPGAGLTSRVARTGRGTTRTRGTSTRGPGTTIDEGRTASGTRASRRIGRVHGVRPTSGVPRGRPSAAREMLRGRT